MPTWPQRQMSLARSLSAAGAFFRATTSAISASISGVPRNATPCTARRRSSPRPWGSVCSRSESRYMGGRCSLQRVQSRQVCAGKKEAGWRWTGGKSRVL